MSHAILPSEGGRCLEGHLLMSAKERDRKAVFEMVKLGTWTLAGASKHLGLSYRQCRRSYRRYQRGGDAGLVHQSRGRRSNRQSDPGVRQAILQRYDEVYEGFGPTLAAEKLAAEGYVIDHETLRRWLLAEGKWQRQRRRSPFRQRRERREQFGSLVQMDGSFHRWFGPDHPETCLIEMIDDATGIRLSLMAEEETTEACMRLLWQWVEHYEIPKALYTDKKNVFVTNRPATLEEQLAGEEPMTAFGKACGKLDMAIIAANSPQAKGRVERAHGVQQDRLVKELRLLGVTTIGGANEVMSGGFVDQLNEKFAKPPAGKGDAHRPVPAGVNLAEVFCVEEQRSVANDWVVRYHNRLLQISKDNRVLPRPKDRVTVRQLLDGRVQVVHAGRTLRYREIEADPVVKGTEPHRAMPQPAKVRAVPKPGPMHPWRHSGIFRGSRASRASRP